MIRNYLIVIIVTVFLLHWNYSNAQNTCTVDSVSYVASRLLDYDVFINSFKVSDAELDWIENEHANWVVEYFPRILTNYDCTLYSKFALAASLYDKGKPQYLCSLWNKYGYLFEIDGERNEEEAIRQIWTLLDWLKINPKDLKDRE